MEKFTKIDLSDWILYRERPNSINYLSKDGSMLLKCVPLDKEEYIEEYIEELEMYNKLKSLNIKTPAVYDIVDVGNNRHGIIYQFIKDKDSISRSISKHPDMVEKYIDLYVDITTKLHSTYVTNNLLPQIEDRIINAINKYGDELFTQSQKKKVLDFINNIPRKDNLLHIDAHYANVISTPNDEVYLIDTAMCAKGHPYYDIGFLYIFTLLSPLDALEGMFHVNLAKLKEMWDCYIKKYFNITTEKEMNNLIKIIKPYGLLAFISHAEFFHMVKYQKYIVDKYFDSIFN